MNSDIAVVGFAHAPHVRETHGTTNGVEMLVPVFRELYEKTGLTKRDIDFWCCGSSDYLAGRAFSFVSAVDAIGAFPPIHESHVESDGAWALYEAWVKIRTGEADTALVYGFGKSSAGHLRRVLAMQLDPYFATPLWPDSISLAGLQARLGIDSGQWTKHQMAEVAVRGRDGASVEDLLAEPLLADPLHRHDCAPITDGASAIILASADRARELCARPAWITGLEHRIDSAELGGRDLTTSPSTAAAAAAIGTDGVELAELHAPFTHQELVLRTAIGLSETVTVNPTGGVLTGNPLFSAGLERIGQAARAIFSGAAGKTLAHATSGPLLQQNLVCVMEGRD